MSHGESDDEEGNPYLRKRRETIERNNQMLQNLGLADATFAPPKQKTKRKELGKAEFSHTTHSSSDYWNDYLNMFESFTNKSRQRQQLMNFFKDPKVQISKEDKTTCVVCEKSGATLYKLPCYCPHASCMENVSNVIVCGHPILKKIKEDGVYDWGFRQLNVKLDTFSKLMKNDLEFMKEKRHTQLPNYSDVTYCLFISGLKLVDLIPRMREIVQIIHAKEKQALFIMPKALIDDFKAKGSPGYDSKAAETEIIFDKNCEITIAFHFCSQDEVILSQRALRDHFSTDDGMQNVNFWWRQSEVSFLTKRGALSGSCDKNRHNENRFKKSHYCPICCEFLDTRCSVEKRGLLGGCCDKSHWFSYAQREVHGVNFHGENCKSSSLHNYMYCIERIMKNAVFQINDDMKQENDFFQIYQTQHHVHIEKNPLLLFLTTMANHCQEGVIIPRSMDTSMLSQFDSGQDSYHQKGPFTKRMKLNDLGGRDDGNSSMLPPFDSGQGSYHEKGPFTKRMKTNDLGGRDDGLTSASEYRVVPPSMSMSQMPMEKGSSKWEPRSFAQEGLCPVSSTACGSLLGNHGQNAEGPVKEKSMFLNDISSSSMSCPSHVQYQNVQVKSEITHDSQPSVPSLSLAAQMLLQSERASKSCISNASFSKTLGAKETKSESMSDMIKQFIKRGENFRPTVRNQKMS